MSKNGKLGLYAKYEKLSGTLITSKVMKRSDAYKSNRDNSSFFWDLITEDPLLMYNTEDLEIPNTSPNWEPNMAFEGHPDYEECEDCLRYVHFEEMYTIADLYDDEASDESICNECARRRGYSF